MAAVVENRELKITIEMPVIICDKCNGEFVIMQQANNSDVVYLIPYFCPICGKSTRIYTKNKNT